MAATFTDSARHLLLHSRPFQLSVGVAVYFTLAALYSAVGDRPVPVQQAVTNPPNPATATEYGMPAAAPSPAPAADQTPVASAPLVAARSLDSIFIKVKDDDAAPAGKDVYRPWPIVIVHPAFSNGGKDIPADDVGQIPMTTNELSLALVKKAGLPLPGTFAWPGFELQGWLTARSAGRYALVATVETATAIWASPQDCLFEGTIDGKTAFRETGGAMSTGDNQRFRATLLGGMALDKGVYRLRLWTTCSAPDRYQPANPPTFRVSFDIKAPGDTGMRALREDDILHQDERSSP